MGWASLVCVLFFGVASVESIPNPRRAGSWVSDTAGVLDPSTEAAIDAVVDRLHREIGVEIAVVTVQDVAGTPKQFATSLFNHWGIGNATHNNGFLFLLVIRQRRLEIEMGTGVEDTFPAAWLVAMQKESMIPQFKRGDFGAGILAGLQRVDERLRSSPAEKAAPPPAAGPQERTDTPKPASSPSPPPPDGSAPRTRAASPGDFGSAWGWVASGGGLAGLFVGAFLLRRRRERARRTCQPCRQRMLLLDEIADDAYLSSGQVTEERVGSVDYRVFVCPGCQSTRVYSHPNRWSNYFLCATCGFHTVKREVNTVVHATYDHGGQVEVTTTCEHCAHVEHTTHRTRKRTPPSESYVSTLGSTYDSSSTFSSSTFSSSTFSSSYDSSSSSGGSFGGGHSSGGGAGSSW